MATLYLLWGLAPYIAVSVLFAAFYFVFFGIGGVFIVLPELWEEASR